MESAKEKLMKEGYLLSPNLVLKNDVDEFLIYLKKLEKKPFVIDDKIYSAFHEKMKEKTIVIRPSNSFRENIETSVKIKKNYVDVNKKFDIKDWLTYYYDRYNKLTSLLKNREEMRSAVSISRLQKFEGNVSFIAMVSNIKKLPSGHFILDVEDPTGQTSVFLSGEAAKVAGEIVFDEVIGIIGSKRGNHITANKILFPDVPQRPIKKGNEEVYAAFVSDVHVGSNMFLPKELSKFISWLNGEVGNAKQKQIASKVKYLFVTGDLVDGIGVYPGQEKELFITDIYRQYEEFSKYFQNIPEDIQLIVCPGNHDALRLAEPQHALFKDLSKAIYDLPNIHMVSNPALVNIHNKDDYPGLDVLMYHGYSLDYYAANVPKLRKTGYDRADLLMEFLLKKRHLAPAHGSTLINPLPQDFLIIDKIPDVFATAHIHKAIIGKYKNITTLSSSCWQDRTSFQEKVGHIPEPARVPLINLKTNEARMLRFK